MSQDTNTTSRVDPGNARIASILRSAAALLAVLCLTAAPAAAEEMYLVRDGRKIEENMLQTDIDPAKNPFWTGWSQRKGETVDGVFVLDKRPKNLVGFVPTKSALGDCEFTMVFRTKHGDYGDRAGGRGPFIFLKDRARIGGWAKGSEFIVWDERMSLALKPYKCPATVDINDGKLHTMSVKRVGDVLTFTVDGKKINEQKINPDVNLIFQAVPQESRPDFAMIKMTAATLSDKLETEFQSAGPLTTLFDGTGKPQEAIANGRATRVPGTRYEPGKSPVYRLPAMVVTTKGTLIVFCEARASKYDWGHIRIVAKRSEDGGKTWGPEIDLSKGKFPNNCIGNPAPVVDRETGRIYSTCHFRTGTGHANNYAIQKPRNALVQYSDDDGKTWSEPKFLIKQFLREGCDHMMMGPVHGIQLTQGTYKGRLVIPVGGPPSNYVVYSDDHGKTWQPGGSGPANGTLNESTAVELLGGDVMINVRTGRGPANRWSFILPDGGAGEYRKGSERYVPDLPDPQCQGTTLRYSWPKDGKPGVILFAGPGSARGRVLGTLFASYDDGKTWPYRQVIYEGGYGYSDIAVLPNGKVACIFELNKQDLLFTALDAPPTTPPAEAAK